MDVQDNESSFADGQSADSDFMTTTSPVIVFAAFEEDKSSNSRDSLSRSRSRKRYRPYNPSQRTRNLHNLKERDRRKRMKAAIESLRSLVPGLDAASDKALVLETTVEYLNQLSAACALASLNETQAASEAATAASCDNSMVKAIDNNGQEMWLEVVPGAFDP